MQLEPGFTARVAAVVLGLGLVAGSIFTPWAVQVSRAPAIARAERDADRIARALSARMTHKIEIARGLGRVLVATGASGEAAFAEHSRAITARHPSVTRIRHVPLTAIGEAGNLDDADLVRTLDSLDAVVRPKPGGMVAVLHAPRPAELDPGSPPLGVVRLDIDLLGADGERLSDVRMVTVPGHGDLVEPRVTWAEGPHLEVQCAVRCEEADESFQLTYVDAVRPGERDLALPSAVGTALASVVLLLSLGSVTIHDTLRRRRRERSRLTGLVAERTAALHERDQRLQLATRELQMQQRALDAAAIVATTDGRGIITYVNEQFELASGYDLDELVGATHAVVNSGVHPGAFFKRMHEDIRGGRTWRGEFCNRRRDGSLYWVDTVIVPRPGADGEPDGFTAFGFDITERKRAEAELGETRDRLDLVIDASRTGTWDYAPTRGRITANESYFTMLGEAPRDTVDNEWFWERLHPEDRLPVLQAFESARTCPEGTYACEFRIRTADGDHRWILSQGRVVQRSDDGQILRIAGVHMDIHAQKSVQEELELARLTAEAATRAKSDFLANMSHEIRTPMTAIIGYAELLDIRDDGPAAVAGRREAVRTIVRNGEHLLGIINDILDLSKIEAEKIEVESIAVALPELVAELRSMMLVRATDKGIGLEVAIDGAIPARIMSDPLRLRQILTNLVGNAIKFTERGAVTIRLSLEPDADERRRLVIAVHDTGIGMTPGQLERLFKPFSQGDETTTRVFGGTGLGLAISRRLAALLGGDITVASAPGRGSTFTLAIDPGPLEPAADGTPVPMVTQMAATLPASAAAETPATTETDETPETPETPETAAQPATSPADPPPPTVHPAAADGPLAALRILLVEDGPDNRRLLGFHLRRAGAEVEEAEHGGIGTERALAAMREGTPHDIILMDMQMPVKDGYTATAELRAAGCTGPIIAVTAHAMSGDRDRCLAAGCDEYLAKPVDRRQLVELCRAFARPNESSGDRSLNAA